MIQQPSSDRDSVVPDRLPDWARARHRKPRRKIAAEGPVGSIAILIGGAAIGAAALEFEQPFRAVIEAVVATLLPAFLFHAALRHVITGPIRWGAALILLIVAWIGVATIFIAAGTRYTNASTCAMMICVLFVACFCNLVSLHFQRDARARRKRT
jgi:hypothetical protein